VEALCDGPFQTGEVDDEWVPLRQFVIAKKSRKATPGIVQVVRTGRRGGEMATRQLLEGAPTDEMRDGGIGLAERLFPSRGIAGGVDTQTLGDADLCRHGPDLLAPPRRIATLSQRDPFGHRFLQVAQSWRAGVHTLPP